MAYNYKQGIYTPINPQKYIGNPNNIVYRSSWERKLMMKFDLSDNIIKWSSEEFPIPYYDSIKRKQRRYFIDFYIMYKNKDGEIVKYAIEVKPYSQTIPPQKPKNNNAKRKKRYMTETLTYKNNQDKWKYAKKWCDDNGFNFIILHERNVGGLF